MQNSPESLDRQRFLRAVVALAAMLVVLVAVIFAGRLKNLPMAKVSRPAATYAYWIDPTPKRINLLITRRLTMRSTIIFRPDMTRLNVTLEPAETPLLEPTPEQLLDIRERLQK